MMFKSKDFAKQQFYIQEIDESSKNWRFMIIANNLILRFTPRPTIFKMALVLMSLSRFILRIWYGVRIRYLQKFEEVKDV